MGHRQRIFILAIIGFLIASSPWLVVAGFAQGQFRIEKLEPVVEAQLKESLSLTGVDQVHSALHADGEGVGILIIDDWSNPVSGATHGKSVSEIIRATAPEANVWLCKLDFTLALLKDFTGCLQEMEQRDLSVDIINMSFSMGDKFYATSCGNELTAFGREIHEHAKNGIIFVAASGNQGAQNGLRFPACHTDVISVAATYDADGSGMVFQSSEFSCRDKSKLDKITCYSNVASYLDLLAPGTIVSTPSNSRFGGTSAAAPVVSGVIALMLSIDPTLTKQSVLRTLRDTGKSVYDERLRKTFARIDAFGALTRVVASTNASTSSNRDSQESAQNGVTLNYQSISSFDADYSGYIDDLEFFDAVESWVRKSISNPLFFQLVDAWTQHAVIATESPVKLEVTLNSSPGSIVFRANGPVDGGTVRIHNLNGGLISEVRGSGTALSWNFHDANQRPVANGVYLYVIEYEINGELIQKHGKLSVLR